MKSNRQSKPNYWYTLVSITAILFILGSFGLFLFKAQRIEKRLKENINIITELKPDFRAQDLQFIRNFLENSPFLKENSLRFISKEEGLQFMKKDFGEDIERLGLQNPLSDLFTFNVMERYMQEDSLKHIRQVLKTQFPLIKDVFYQESLTHAISQNLRKISIFLAGISVLISILAAVLIHNTAKLALSGNRFLIKNMQLVGAKPRFIKKPYLRKSLGQGILSALLAFGMLMALAWWFDQKFPDLKMLNNPLDYALLFIVLLSLGTLINYFSTYFAVQNFLRSKSGDLY